MLVTYILPKGIASNFNISPMRNSTQKKKKPTTKNYAQREATSVIVSDPGIRRQHPVLSLMCSYIFSNYSLHLVDSLYLNNFLLAECLCLRVYVLFYNNYSSF